MARVTVEDCVVKVPNRFELCLVASNRAKTILSGAPTKLDKKEKPAVISLREISQDLVDIDTIKKNIVINIKNRGVMESVQSIQDINEEVYEEVSSQLKLKDDSFVSENLEVVD